MAKRHEIAPLVEDDDLVIVPAVLDVLRQHPHVQPLDAPRRQRLLDVEIQHQRRVPEPRQRRVVALACALALVAALAPLLAYEPLDHLRPHVRDEPDALVRESLARLEPHPLVDDVGLRLAVPRNVHADAIHCLPELRVRQVLDGHPVGVLAVGGEPSQVRGRRGQRRIWRPPRRQRETALRRRVGVRHVRDHLFPSVLR